MLGAVCHHLRTPLTSLRPRLDRMEPPQGRDRAIAVVDEIAQLLDDILELARTGKSQAPAARCNLSALVADVVACLPP